MYVYILNGVPYATIEAAMRDALNYGDWVAPSNREQPQQFRSASYRVWHGRRYEEDSEGNMVASGEAQIEERLVID